MSELVLDFLSTGGFGGVRTWVTSKRRILSLLLRAERRMEEGRAKGEREPCHLCGSTAPVHNGRCEREEWFDERASARFAVVYRPERCPFRGRCLLAEGHVGRHVTQADGAPMRLGIPYAYRWSGPAGGLP